MPNQHFGRQFPQTLMQSAPGPPLAREWTHRRWTRTLLAPEPIPSPDWVLVALHLDSISPPPPLSQAMIIFGVVECAAGQFYDKFYYPNAGLVVGRLSPLDLNGPTNCPIGQFLCKKSRFHLQIVLHLSPLPPFNRPFSHYFFFRAKPHQNFVNQINRSEKVKMVVTLPKNQAANQTEKQKTEMGQQASAKQNCTNTNGVAAQGPKSYVLEAIPNKNVLDELTNYAIDFCHSIGNVALWNERKDCNDLSVTPPISLLPSAFPAELFEKAKSVQQTLSELYFRISMDHDFLVEAYKDVVKADKWIAKQIEMMEQVRADGLNQKLYLQFQRADYMSHWDEQEGKMELKQVEVNIGQVGGPGCATAMAKLHKRMLEKAENLHFGTFRSMETAKTPENHSRRGMAETLLQAWKMFADPHAVVVNLDQVFMNQPDLFPVCHYEQLQFIQYELEKIARKEGHHLNVVRLSIKECPQRMHLDEKDFSLYVDGNKRVAVVHMAYGYLPEHYPTEKEWKSRMDMERSTAIISPNIRLSLAGSKKIQQVLAKPGVIERFLPNQPEKIAELRTTFTGLWGLENDDERIRAVIEDAIQKPRNYVMKAQLGAGKGNYFDEDMAKMLREMSVEERGAYILQQKIWPVVTKNYMKRPFDAPILENIVSELGIYGSFIGTEEEGGKVLWNRVEGYLVRSKPHNVNQGGVSEGGGVVDSLLLFPESEMH